MGAGIQPPTVQQSGGNAFLDVFKVLYEPGAVFQRVAQKPSFLAPYLVICAVQLVLFFVNLPFLKAAMAAQFAQAPAGSDPSKFLVFGAIGIPIVFALILLISSLVLWVLVSVMGGDGKFGTLLSVTSYSAVPAAIVLGVIGAIILQMKGASQITTPQDMQPAVGLDLLVSNAKGFTGAILKGINPFNIWGLVLTAIGVQTTHRLSKGTSYTIATIAFVLGLCIAGVFASFQR
jgi:hypothetical protein